MTQGNNKNVTPTAYDGRTQEEKDMDKVLDYSLEMQDKITRAQALAEALKLMLSEASNRVNDYVVGDAAVLVDMLTEVLD